MRGKSLPVFDTEAALCSAFIAWCPPEWIAYPETGGFDILLVHRVGSWQIGVEAKKTLNTKVLEQAIRGRRYGNRGPDFRAVLVGKAVAESATLARALGITVIAPKPIERVPDWLQRRRQRFGPKVPEFGPGLPESEHLERIGTWWSAYDREIWFDQFPTSRIDLPDYVPEVKAGVPSPMVLSDWKIKAMRVCAWVEKHGTITRAVFRDLGIDPSRWMNGVWLEATETRGVWRAGPRFPADQMRKEHPAIFQKIEADYPEWSKKVKGASHA